MVESAKTWFSSSLNRKIVTGVWICMLGVGVVRLFAASALAGDGWSLVRSASLEFVSVALNTMIMLFMFQGFAFAFSGDSLMEDAVFRDRVAQLEIDLLALEMTVLRVASAESAGKAPGPEASILKIKGTEIQQALTELQMEAVGPNALPFLPMAWGEHWIGQTPGPIYAAPLAARYLNMRKTTIYGGTNEIQRNIISQQVLGL